MKLNVLDGFSVMFLFRFRNECPDGKLTKHHLKTLFEKVFPDGRWLPTIWNHLDFVPGNASKITSQIFRIFDSDGNDFLDFKEFLMAIDVANRTTGAFLNFQRIFNPSCEISFCLFFATLQQNRWYFVLKQMKRSWGGLSGCMTWTTTGWSTWRKWSASLRLWTASKGSNQVLGQNGSQ